jgi:central glycolytic genes regulator
LLSERKAVGEAFGYYFDELGKEVHRVPTIGLQLEEVANIKTVIAVAGGTSKAKAMLSYLQRAPKHTCLITDEGAAREMLEIVNRS